MEFSYTAKLLTAESKPYSVDGNTGTSHSIRLNVDGEIYVCKSTAEQVSEYKDFEGVEGEAKFKLESRKENLKLKLVSFVK